MFSGVFLSDVFSDVQWTLLLFVALVATSLLGFLLGAIFFYWPISEICRRHNGAPLKVGDQVLILSGPEKGNMAEVNGITLGQGGQMLAMLDLGQERKGRCADLFEEYSLLKISKGEQAKPSE
jgi:hypothetical protein